MAKCLYCGKEITGKSHKKGVKELKYCNRDCYNATRHINNFGYAVCFYCGKRFKETRDRPNTYCSKSCASKHAHRIKAIERAETHKVNPETLERFRIVSEQLDLICDQIISEKQCEYCGKWFSHNGRINYCSEQCAKKADNIKHDKRLTRNGKADYSITLPRLYDRDNGICQLCGAKLSFIDDYNSGFYPSIDHIKPLSKGGLHRWDNVQLACRRCNTLKRDKE